MHLRDVGKALGAAALMTLGTACIDEIVAPECSPVTLTTTGTAGDTVTLSTGLRLIEGAQGSGLPAAWCASVAVHYIEYLLDGTKLESSLDRQVPLTFTPGLGDLIDGFEQGVVGMRVGAKRRLFVPANLAYGSQGRRNASGAIVVPPNATLVYDVEVVAVSQPQ